MDSTQGKSDRDRWRILMRKSFDPRDWFSRDDDLGDEARGATEVQTMWVYRKCAIGYDTMYEVGFFTPTREWESESTYKTKEEAAARVHWLNGGDTTAASVPG